MVAPQTLPLTESQCATAAREERRAGLRLAEAQKLIQYLERRQGSLVTLQHTLVKDRALTLPTIPGAAVLQAATPGQNLSAAPVLKIPGAQASASTATGQLGADTPRSIRRAHARNLRWRPPKNVTPLAGQLTHALSAPIRKSRGASRRHPSAPSNGDSELKRDAGLKCCPAQQRTVS
jgi:hypothetical protein